MPDDHTTDDIVHESALQLWAAAQTDFDPFEVPPEEWGPNVVPVRDADIAHDTHLDLAVVRESIGGWRDRASSRSERGPTSSSPGSFRTTCRSELVYSPSIRPMISFWISVVPP